MNSQRFQLSNIVERPAWWRVRPDEITADCAAVRQGRADCVAITPGNQPVWRLVYHDFEDVSSRRVSWPSALASRHPEVFNEKVPRQTVLIAAGIHGCEIEGVVTLTNLLQLLETGRDLRGKKRDRLLELCRHYRLVLFPCVNMDGRLISPDHRIGADEEECRRSGGGWWLKDNATIAWPDMKEHFPLPLKEVGYPGGYPNSQGYNIQMDAAPGNLKTAEAEAILKAAAEMKADFFLNLHSQPDCPNTYATNLSIASSPEAISAFFRVVDRLYPRLQQLGCQAPGRQRPSLSAYLDLNTAVSMACGAATLTFEFAARLVESFDQVLETGFTLLEAVLEEGVERPFLNRQRQPGLDSEFSKLVSRYRDEVCSAWSNQGKP
jgi:hypothetical protein